MEVIFCAKFEKRPYVKVKEEKIIFDDGETTFLGTGGLPPDWADVSGSTSGFDSPQNKIAVVLGAVNGANYCNYTTQIMQQLQLDGFRVVLVHYRNFKMHSPPAEKDPKVGHADPAKHLRGLLLIRRPRLRDKAYQRQVPRSSDVPRGLLHGFDSIDDVARTAERKERQPRERIRGDKLPRVSEQSSPAPVSVEKHHLCEQHDQSHAQNSRGSQRAGRG